METNNEIIDNLKESVIAKLDELDSSKNHDSTLIDYILVMVVNQKSKFEMKHNLALFLGKIVDDFVNWLFDYLSEPKIDDNILNSIDQVVAKDEVLLENQQVTNGNLMAETIKDAPEIYVPEVKNNTLKTKKSPKKKLKSAIISNMAEKKVVDKQKEFTKSKKRSIVNDEETTHKAKKRALINNEHHALSVVEETNEKPKLPDDLKNKTNIESISMENEKADNTKENEIHFLVTLDGVKDMFKDDLILMDEEFDPELMKEDLSTFNSSATKNESNVQQAHSNKQTERCKYWPSCLNGTCEYFHPVTKCNTFPYCRFGDKCLYIHPTCKYDTVCTRKDCPYVHTSKRIPIRPQVHPTVVVPTCKYYPNCMKPACEFFHPKACHFGAACKSFNCPYIHSSTQNIPHPSRLKWSSTKTISNLPLNDNEEIEIKLI